MSNLNFDQVAANQNQKEVTINDAFDQVDDALTEHLAVDLSAADVSLTTDQWTRNWFFEMSGHTVARTVTLPPTKRPGVVKNAGTGTVTLQVLGGGSAVVQPAQTVMIYSNGVNLTMVGGGASAFTDLTDTFASYAGQGGRMLRVRADGSGIEPSPLRAPPAAASFTTVTGGATVFTLQDDSDVGLQAICTPSNGLDNCHIAYRTLSDKTKDWTLTAHFNFLIDTANWSGLGIMAMDSVSGRVEMVVFETRTTNARPIWRRMNSLTSFNTDPYTNSAWGPMGWMRWRKVTADAKLYFDMSPDGKTWHNYVAYAPDAWLTNLADRVGIGFYSHLTSQREFSCDYFSLTGPAV